MKINYSIVSRSLIALLFVVAGYQKLVNFSGTVDAIVELVIPLASFVASGTVYAIVKLVIPLVAIVVILIEIPVALAFAYGYKTRQMGYALIAFTVLVTLIVHRDVSQPMNILMGLKNLAIIGGLMSAIMCFCGDCMVHTKKGEHHVA